MKTTKIEWTETTWNPTTGCTKISEGCANCYAESMANRLKAMGLRKYEGGFDLCIHKSELITPYKWKKPQLVFVNSMSDLFHQKIPFSFIKDVFRVMNDCNRHTYQILTKRADILFKYSGELQFSDNIWAGVTVENRKVISRIDYLREIPAKIRFLSLEPLLGPLENLNLDGINWVIVGGESGPKSRPISEEWVIDIKEQCELNSIPFFFKQWGGKNKKASGKLLQGRTYQQTPLNYNRKESA